MKILLTGSTGFVGSNLKNSIAESSLRCVSRHDGKSESVIIPEINGSTNWEQALDGVTCVIHCAARVHIMHNEMADPLEQFREVNAKGTANFARQSAAANVKRFILLSSIKVNGEFSDRGRPFLPSDEPQAQDPYGISKCEAEQALKQICADTGMEYVIIRPPLVYGPGVKANFLSILKWVSRGVPLPLGGIKHNNRSLVYIDNLVDLIKVCCDHPAAANQTFLVSDGEDVSTRVLFERVAAALGVGNRLLPIPTYWIEWAGKLFGKRGMERRLCGSLQVDIQHTKTTLAWAPPYSMEQGLKKTADWFKTSKT